MECSPHCAVCSKSGICLECLPKYRLGLSNSCVEFSPCKSNYRYETESISCQECPSSCTFCDLSGNCLLCNFSFFLDPNINSCLPCSDNCLLCFNPQICIKCNSGFLLEKDSKLCYSASNDSNEKDILLFELFKQELRNYKDKMEEVWSSNLTLEPNCMTAYINKTCLFCKPSYYKGNNSRCLSCSSNCLKCDNESTCLKCSSSYELTKVNGSFVCSGKVSQ